MTDPPRARSAADNQLFIRDQIKSYILEHHLSSGDPLPTEPNLMAQLGIGRHPLREAMKALQAVGIVEVRHGYGTYVGQLNLQSLEDGLSFRMSQSMTGDLREVRNVLEVRTALEVGLADRVVAELGEKSITELTEIVERMEAKATEGTPLVEDDWEFHRALYEPLGNSLIIDLVSVFWRTFTAVDPQLPGTRYSGADAAGWHRDLLEALKAGNAPRFAEAMKAHFTGIQTRLNE